MKKVNSIVISWILFGVSMIISSIFLFKISKFYSFSDKAINLDITNGIGNFIGGIIGPILSLVGSLLIFETIRLQRKSIKNKKKEIQFDRDINIFMKYTEKIENKIDKFKIGEKKDISLITDLF